MREFLRGVFGGFQSAPPEQKARIETKFESLDARGTWEYAKGYGLGIVEGLWMALKALFEALVTLVKLPFQIQQFLAEKVPQLAAKYRWLPACADAVDNSIPKPRTPDEPKMEELLGTELNKALVEAIASKSNYTSIAQTHLNNAANQITAYLKQQGTY